MTKSSAKTARRKTHPKAASKIAGKKIAGKVGMKVASEKAHHAQLKVDGALQPFPSTRLHDTFRGLAERNVTQTRELYQHSHDTLKTILDSWDKTFGAAGQGAMALSRRIIDIADRHINNALDLGANLAGAKNLTEVLEVQAAYLRKQFLAVGSRQSRSKRMLP